MNYEIVELQEKKIVGLKARTSNESPEMQGIIASLWQRLYEPSNMEKVTNRSNEYAIGLYSDYEGDEYDVTVGFEVKDVPADTEFEVKVIPAGRYAKFSVHGDMVQAVGATWGEIWATPLDRTYTGDFEEYVSMEDIDIYIAIK